MVWKEKRVKVVYIDGNLKSGDVWVVNGIVVEDLVHSLVIRQEHKNPDIDGVLIEIGRSVIITVKPLGAKK